MDDHVKNIYSFFQVISKPQILKNKYFYHIPVKAFDIIRRKFLMCRKTRLEGLLYDVIDRIYIYSGCVVKINDCLSETWDMGVNYFFFSTIYRSSRTLPLFPSKTFFHLLVRLKILGCWTDLYRLVVDCWWYIVLCKKMLMASANNDLSFVW